MDIPATELRNNLAGRAALFMAILGIGLVGYVVGGWFGPASESVTVDSASPVGAQGVSDGGASLAVLAVGLGLLGLQWIAHAVTSRSVSGGDA